MVIDCHTHLMSPNFLAKPYWDAWIKLFSSASGRSEEYVTKKLPDFWDETGDSLIKDMDEAGIDQSWISVLDLGLVERVGECRHSIAEVNRLYAQVAQMHDKRIIAFVGVDPRREEAVELLEKGVKEWGMRGLKLMPAAGFYPDDRICYKLYSKAVDLGIPIIVHTGPEAIPLYSKYCQPVFLDKVANDFPDLKLILAHAGYCWWQEALNIAASKPNIYLDISGWQPKVLRRPISEFYIPLRTILNTIGSSRVLFGSDWPAYRLFMGGQINWIKIFKEPLNALKEVGIGFSEDEMEAILGGNASSLIAGVTGR